MNRTKIDWPGLNFTWNVITGCRRGCSYCYARRIHERFYKTQFSDIVFHPGRLSDPDLYRKPASKIFVSSMSVPEYWKREYMELIIDTIERKLWNRKHTFMFLSKNTNSYNGFYWPDNTMCGLTITGEIGMEERDFTNIILHKKKHRPFLSIEPLLGIIPKTDYSGFELVIVGAMTGKNAIVPQQDWIQSIKDNIPAEKIYWKKNIRGI
jgi:protein gp37